MLTVKRDGQSVTFSFGDVVRLRSGGPPMTIFGFNRGMAVCTWIMTRKHPITGVDEHTIATHMFNPITLTKEPRDQTR